LLIKAHIYSPPEDFENPEGESMLLDWEGGEIVYTYDGDGREAPPSEAVGGNLVKSVIDNKTTYYPNQYYKKRMVDSQQTILKYYFVGSARNALKENGTIFAAFRFARIASQVKRE